MSDWSAIAREKLTRVLGATKGATVFDATMLGLGMFDLATADDLYAFSQELTKLGGYEAAVGGLLSVQAAIAGASRRPSSAA